jgi:hypothetical protein
MVISPLILILVVVVLALLLGGSGYGYYNGGGYASPLALLGGLLIVGLVVWFVLGGGIWFSPPTKQIEIEERQPAREPSKIKIEREGERPGKESERKERSERRERSLREQEQPAIERLIKKDSGEVKL